MKRYCSIFSALIFISLLFLGCSKDDPTSDNPDSQGTVQDVDGNTYHTVKIGTQTWMVENLKTTKYRNGDPIDNVTENSQWINLTTGAYCNYNHNSTVGDKYGRLYNWYAANDSRKLAPEGWHIPDNDEIQLLKDFIEANIGTSGSAAKTLAAQTDWMTGSSIGNDLSTNNSTGFTALPAGIFKTNIGSRTNIFEYLGSNTYWWSSDTYQKIDGFDYAWMFSLGISSQLTLGHSQATKTSGFSVRCLKD